MLVTSLPRDQSHKSILQYEMICMNNLDPSFTLAACVCVVNRHLYVTGLVIPSDLVVKGIEKTM